MRVRCIKLDRFNSHGINFTEICFVLFFVCFFFFFSVCSPSNPFSSDSPTEQIGTHPRLGKLNNFVSFGVCHQIVVNDDPGIEEQRLFFQRSVEVQRVVTLVLAGQLVGVRIYLQNHCEVTIIRLSSVCRNFLDWYVFLPIRYHKPTLSCLVAQHPEAYLQASRNSPVLVQWWNQELLLELRVASCFLPHQSWRTERHSRVYLHLDTAPRN